MPARIPDARHDDREMVPMAQKERGHSHGVPQRKNQRPLGKIDIVAGIQMTQDTIIVGGRPCACPNP